jgi:hypothetical protein
MDFVTALGNSIKSGFCQATEAADRYYTIFQNIWKTPPLSLPSFPGALNAIFCNRDPDNLPVNPPPFTGGQCNGTKYRVTAVVERFIGGFAPDPPVFDNVTIVSGDTGTEIWGPIQAIALTGFGENGRGYNGYTWLTITARDSSTGTIAARNFSSFLFSYNRIVSITVTPISGADTCGNPPAPLPTPLPPGDNTVGDDLDFDDEDGISVTVPIVLIYGTANINVNGQIIIPVDVQIGPNTIEVDLNLNTGNISFGPSYTTNNPSDGTGGRGTNSPCEQPPEVDEDDDEPDNGVPTETPIEDKESDIRVIIGAIVTVTNEGNGIGEVNGDPYNAPDIGVPRFGDLMFEVRIANRTAWLNDIPVKLARVYIPCPWEAGALRVVGIPKPGVVWTITPVYSRIKKPRDTTT